MPPKGFKTITLKAKTYRALKLFQRHRGLNSIQDALEELLEYVKYI